MLCSTNILIWSNMAWCHDPTTTPGPHPQTATLGPGSQPLIPAQDSTTTHQHHSHLGHHRAPSHAATRVTATSDITGLLPTRPSPATPHATPNITAHLTWHASRITPRHHAPPSITTPPSPAKQHHAATTFSPDS